MINISCVGRHRCILICWMKFLFVHKYSSFNIEEWQDSMMGSCRLRCALRKNVLCCIAVPIWKEKQLYLWQLLVITSSRQCVVSEGGMQRWSTDAGLCGPFLYVTMGVYYSNIFVFRKITSHGEWRICQCNGFVFRNVLITSYWTSILMKEMLIFYFYFCLVYFVVLSCAPTCFEQIITFLSAQSNKKMYMLNISATAKFGFL